MTRFTTRIIRPQRRGFSLAEVLVAIVILLIGVVVALKIFPVGFNIFSEAQQTHVALKLLNAAITGFEQDPDSLPDMILPVDCQFGSASAFMVSASAASTLMDDLYAVDYSANAASNTLWSPYLSPVGNGSWPLWQPASLRIMRKIVGERCQIPAELMDWKKDAASTAVNIALMPKYVPRFAPIVANGYWSASAGNYVMDKDPIIVYDLRYRHMTEGQLDGALSQVTQNANSLPNHFYYALEQPRTTNNGLSNELTLTLLPDTQARQIRLSFCYLSTAGDIKQFGPAVITIPAIADLSALVSIQLKGQNIVSAWPADFRALVPGSEQLNRAYQRLAALSTDLQSGQYYIDGLSSSTPTINAIFFSRVDGGHAVKVDYTVADWNILHEDLTVDEDGYLNLAVADPKIVNKQVFPREPNTWGLFEPMSSSSTAVNVVIGLVDLHTGVSYNVNYLPGNLTDKYQIDPDKLAMLYPSSLDTVNLAQSARGRVRVGSKAMNSGNPWSALAGTRYRVFYRAQRDWTLQVYKPPSAFWQVSDPNNLGWYGFYALGNQVAVPSVYQGQSVAVDYSYKDELCRAIASTNNTTLMAVNSVAKLAPNMVVRIYNPSAPTAPINVTIKTIDNDNQLTLTAAATVENGAYILDPDPTLPLQRASGELHTVPTGLNANGIFRLAHFPAPSTAITVRGVSVTVRALWMQPRHGSAWLIDNSFTSWPQPPLTPPTRPLNEQWQAKALTIILPAAKE